MRPLPGRLQDFCQGLFAVIQHTIKSITRLPILLQMIRAVHEFVLIALFVGLELNLRAQASQAPAKPLRQLRRIHWTR